MPQERRQRRVITNPPPAPVITDAPMMMTEQVRQMPQVPAVLAQQLQQLRDIVRTKQYRLIGRLSRVQVVRPAGARTIDFRKEGPVLAWAGGQQQQIVVTTPWNGIPAKLDDTDQFCPDCQAACDVCGAKGEKLCEGYKCGGSGEVPLPMVTCPAKGCLASTGKVKPGCKQCGSTGNFTPKGKCLTCHGTGQARCSSCRGTKKRPTGIQDGSYDWRKPACATCQGSKFAHTEIPQPLGDYVDARVGPMVAIGPVIRFAVESVGGEGSPPQVFDVEADTTGRHMVILLESETPGAGVYMLGGVLNSVTRQ